MGAREWGSGEEDSRCGNSGMQSFFFRAPKLLHVRPLVSVSLSTPGYKAVHDGPPAHRSRSRPSGRFLRVPPLPNLRARRHLRRWSQRQQETHQDHRRLPRKRRLGFRCYLAAIKRWAAISAPSVRTAVAMACARAATPGWRACSRALVSEAVLGTTGGCALPIPSSLTRCAK